MLSSPAPWAATGIVVVAAAWRYANGPTEAVAASLAAGILSAFVGTILLRITAFDAFRILGAACLVAGVGQAAAPLATLHGVVIPTGILWVGTQFLLAGALVLHLATPRHEWRIFAACVGASILLSGMWLLPGLGNVVAWVPAFPLCLLLFVLVRLVRQGTLWRTGPAGWLVLSACGGVVHGALRLVDGGLEVPTAASLSAMAMPLGILLSALDRAGVLFAEAEQEATSFRDANRALILSSDLARRLQRRTEALRDIRDAVHSMDAEDDLEAVLTAVRQALEQLRVPFNFCGLNLVEKTATGYRVRSHGLDATDRWQVTNTEGSNSVIHCWESKEVDYRRDLQQEDAHDEREFMEYLFGVSIRSVVDVPFSHGTLAVNSTAANAFDGETLSDLQGLTEVLAEGFRRLDEIRDRRRVEGRLNSFFTHSFDLLCVATFDGYLQRVNPAWTATLGYVEEELIARPLQDFIHADDLRGTLVKVARLRRGTPTVTFENRFVHKDGSLRWLSWTAARDPDGSVVYGTAQDVTQRVLTEQQLKLSKEAAESARLAQSQFLANMNHELRTPLNAIIGYSELLMEEAEEDAGADPGAVEDLERIRGAAHKLLGMIDELLELSRIEAGHVELRLEWLQPAALVEQLGNEVTAQMQARGNQLHVDVSAAPDAIHTDRLKARQIVLHLLSNAAKFTEGGDVHVIVRSASRLNSDGVEFVVEDTGPGIEADRLDQIFSAFQQVDGSARRSHGGTGLGLTLSRRFCELLGGTIGVRSTPGHGSEFTVWLPVDGESAIASAVAETRTGGAS